MFSTRIDKSLAASKYFPLVAKLKNEAIVIDAQREL